MIQGVINYGPAKCAYCNGKGGFRDNDEYDKCFVTCDACEGSGWAYELREK